MALEAKQSQVVQEGTTPQQQEQQNPEQAHRVASNVLPLPIPFPNRDDLAKGKPRGGRIEQPVEPHVDS